MSPTIAQRINSILFLIKNAVLRRPLQLKQLEYDSVLALEGCELDIFWETGACHKIKINGQETIPGTCKGVRLLISDIKKPVHISFYGYRQSIQQTLHIQHLQKVHLPQKFNTSMHLPQIRGSMHSQQTLQSVFSGRQIRIQIPID